MTSSHTHFIRLTCLWFMALSTAAAQPPVDATPYAPELQLQRSEWPTLFTLGDQLLQVRGKSGLVVRDARGHVVAEVAVPLDLQRRATLFADSPVAAGWVALARKRLTIAMWPTGGTSLVHLAADPRHLDDPEAADALSGRMILAWSPWSGGADLLALHHGTLRLVTIGVDGDVRSRALDGVFLSSAPDAQGRLTVAHDVGGELRISDAITTSDPLPVRMGVRLDDPVWLQGDLAAGTVLWLVTQPQQMGELSAVSLQDGRVERFDQLPLGRIGLPGARKLVEPYDRWELLGTATSDDRWLVTLSHNGTRTESFQALSYDADPNTPPRTSDWTHQLGRVTTVVTDHTLTPLVTTTLPIRPASFVGSRILLEDPHLSEATLTPDGFEWHFVSPASGVQSAWWHRVVWNGEGSPVTTSFQQAQTGQLVGTYGPRALLRLHPGTLLFPVKTTGRKMRLMQVPIADAP